MKSVNVLGVQVDCVDKTRLLEQVLSWVRSRERRTVMYVNAHCLNLSSGNPAYRADLNRADLVYADGIGVVLAGRLLGNGQMAKATGSDWIADLCARLAAQGARIYILAGKPGVAEAARLNLTARWPGLQIAGLADGYFHGKSETEVLQDIARTAPDLLFVGMGTPRQERWIIQHGDALAVPVCWAVGSLFDLVAGMESWPPVWVSRLGLQWFWRWLMDPIGKFRRYILGNPLFLYRVVRQRLVNGRAAALDPAAVSLPGRSRRGAAVERRADNM